MDSPDRKSLEMAKDAMEDVNAYINEMKRDDETCSLIRDVERGITDLVMVRVLLVFFKFLVTNRNKFVFSPKIFPCWITVG